MITKKILRLTILVLAMFFGFTHITLAGDKEHTKLEDAMDATNKAFRTIRRQIKDPSKNKESAKLVNKMIAESKKSLRYEPKWTIDKPKEEQKIFVEDYRKGINNLVSLLEKLKLAFEEGDNADAQVIVDELRSLQKESHKLYKKPKPKKE